MCYASEDSVLVAVVGGAEEPSELVAAPVAQLAAPSKAAQPPVASGATAVAPAGSPAPCAPATAQALHRSPPAPAPVLAADSVGFGASRLTTGLPPPPGTALPLSTAQRSLPTGSRRVVSRSRRRPAAPQDFRNWPVPAGAAAGILMRMQRRRISSEEAPHAASSSAAAAKPASDAAPPARAAALTEHLPDAGADRIAEAAAAAAPPRRPLVPARFVHQAVPEEALRAATGGRRLRRPAAPRPPRTGLPSPPPAKKLRMHAPASPGSAAADPTSQRSGAHACVANGARSTAETREPGAPCLSIAAMDEPIPPHPTARAVTADGVQQDGTSQHGYDAAPDRLSSQPASQGAEEALRQDDCGCKSHGMHVSREGLIVPQGTQKARCTNKQLQLHKALEQAPCADAVPPDARAIVLIDRAWYVDSPQRRRRSRLRYAKFHSAKRDIELGRVRCYQLSRCTGCKWCQVYVTCCAVHRHGGTAVPLLLMRKVSQASLPEHP